MLYIILTEETQTGVKSNNYLGIWIMQNKMKKNQYVKKLQI